MVGENQDIERQHDRGRLAKYFQAHKEDEDEWEDAPPPKVRRKKSPLTVNLSVRFSAAEAVAIQQEAARLGLTSSELVRRAVQHQCDRSPSATRHGRRSVDDLDLMWKRGRPAILHYGRQGRGLLAGGTLRALQGLG